MALENAELVEVDVAVAFKHMNRAIENSKNYKLGSFEGLFHAVRQIHNSLLVKASFKSYVLPTRLQL
jgi:hypothetical protein